MVDLEDVRNVQCNFEGCNEPFEIEPAEGEYPAEAVVPVECEKGKFCSEAHRAQAMYDAQNDNDKQLLRRYYLGAQLMVEYEKMPKRLMEEWGIDCCDDPDAVASALSPDGGAYGKPGVEDDCEAYLLPKEVRAILFTALREGVWMASLRVNEYAKNAERWQDEFWKMQLADAQKKLAEAEAAVKALAALGVIV